MPALPAAHAVAPAPLRCGHPPGGQAQRGGSRAEDLHLLEALLVQLVEGQYELWRQIAGRRELLRSALRQAVQQAPSSKDVGPRLERWWALLTDDRTALRVADFYRRDPDYEHVPVDHDRVLLGALRLIATAQAAVAALQPGQGQPGKRPDAAARLDQWSGVAAGLFGRGDPTPGVLPGSEPNGKRVRQAGTTHGPVAAFNGRLFLAWKGMQNVGRPEDHMLWFKFIS